MSESKRTVRTKLPHGEGSVYPNPRSDGYIAEVTVAFDARGKRVVRRGYGKTQNIAIKELRRKVKEYEDGLTVEAARYKVEDAVRDWLKYGQGTTADNTWEGYRFNCERHLIPALGKRRLRDLTATEVEEWLASLTMVLGTSMLKQLHSNLNRSVKRAMARGMAARNVIELCTVPEGRAGRASRSMTEAQVRSVLEHCKSDPIYPYIVLSILTGLRTEEVRALQWDRVDLDGDPGNGRPPSVMVWRSARRKGDTKTKKSRRTLALPAVVVASLRLHRTRQTERDMKLGREWDPNGFVFGTRNGTMMSSRNVSRDVRRALAKVPGIVPDEWTPRDWRHTYTSVMSAGEVPLEEVSRTLGHSSTVVTEQIYRHELRPVIQTAGSKMDELFPVNEVGVGWHMEPLFGPTEAEGRMDP
jgi:integrase